ncbi:hypothetical protein G6O69_01740 [Pseudenhygromyxa sp. WMMC2535]|uniref:hypothetical protein n=1 Tax=Pseudenhygromyxa sp. WMMC2535 TaxID=2712867 RepID=UPI00155243D6|nr:hypothetical protein [Pseudenhygromyxa sp. WMMC2535]NVB36536.1 hypothetical protein [Pseudenhygromyxa sp. WMMC2535]
MSIDEDFDPAQALAQVYNRASEAERPLLFPALESEHDRGVYVRWLEAHDPVRAELLELAARLEDSDDPAATERLAALLEGVDPQWWWLFQRTEIRNCGAGRARPKPLRFRLLCPESWTTLAATGDPRIRDCERCGEQVHRCATLEQANEHAQRGECIAVEPSLAREGAGRDAKLVILGRPDYVAMWAEQLFGFEGDA